jgi:putative intracellular protease/amidase/YHS domain-containing protein
MIGLRIPQGLFAPETRDRPREEFMKSNSLSRRSMMQMSAGLGVSAIAMSPMVRAASLAITSSPGSAPPDHTVPALRFPESGTIPVAFLLSTNAVVIDFAGPWEVFREVRNRKTGQAAFRPYVVAETTAPLRVSGGMTIVPNYALDDAPAPQVVVIPAQDGESPAMLSWIREVSMHAGVTMSVCTGAFLLAKTGLLDGRRATTHHSAYSDLEVQYPNIHVERGLRYVEDGNLASSGGLSSGIDLALHVVARYFDDDVAQETAFNMEYQGMGWKDPGLNAVYKQATLSTPSHPLCQVCRMEPDTTLSSVYKGKTYYFCETEHKRLFDLTPEKFI